MQVVRCSPLRSRQWQRLGAALLTTLGAVALVVLAVLVAIQVQETYQHIQHRLGAPLYSGSFRAPALYDAPLPVWSNPSHGSRTGQTSHQ